MKLYSNGCPQCKVLKNELDGKQLVYETISDMEEIIKVASKNNIRNMPILEVDGKIMDYRKALEYIKGV